MQPIDPESIDEDAKKAGKKCPVCEDGPFLYNGYICDICGWEFDDCDELWPNEPSVANNISFNDYKRDFEEKRKKNPKYIWTKYKYSKRGY